MLISGRACGVTVANVAVLARAPGAVPSAELQHNGPRLNSTLPMFLSASASASRSLICRSSASARWNDISESSKSGLVVLGRGDARRGLALEVGRAGRRRSAPPTSFQCILVAVLRAVARCARVMRAALTTSRWPSLAHRGRAL